MKVKFRHLWLRWSWPNVLAYQSFWSTYGTPWWPNLAICAIFTTFWESGEKDHPKVRVYREKFNIDFFAPDFFGSSYICGGAHISSGDFKTHRDGHNHRHRHRSPVDFSRIDKNSEINFFLNWTPTFLEKAYVKQNI